MGNVSAALLLVTVPGSADYPNHLARHHVFAAIGDGTALSAYFDVDWRWVGNLGVDLPVLALTPWLGVEMATRVVSTLIAPLTVLGILLLSRSVHGRVTASAMLALPFAIAQHNVRCRSGFTQSSTVRCSSITRLSR